jgi:hypothetical protein
MVLGSGTTGVATGAAMLTGDLPPAGSRLVSAPKASAHYTPEATTWVKIKNREYSQAVGREDFFDRRKL